MQYSSQGQSFSSGTHAGKQHGSSALLFLTLIALAAPQLAAQNCTPGTKPTNVAVGNVSPSTILENPDTNPSFTLSFQLIGGSLQANPVLNAFRVNFGGLISASLPASSVSGSGDSWSAQFSVDRTFLTPGQIVALSASVTICNEGTSTSGTTELQVRNHVPQIQNLNPSTLLVPGGEGFTLTVNGSGFNRDSRLQWNGVARGTSPLSSTRLSCSILKEDVASAGTFQVRVVNPAPGGGTSNSIAFTVGPPPPPPPPPPPNDPPTLFVPIVLSASGQGSSFFTSELTLTNRSSQNASLEFTYTGAAAFGGGGGTATDALAAGRQRIIPDTIAYLKSLGIPIPPGNHGGTLVVRFNGVSNSAEGSVTVRTTTVAPGGVAGLAYAGVPREGLLNGSVYLCALRQNGTDRTNIAMQNAGSAAAGDITLRVTVISGDAANPLQRTLPDEVLPPGGFKQIGQVLTSNGLSLSNGFVRIERINGTAPFYCYAVINDQANSDGSFVPPVLENAMAGRVGLTLPVIVETSAFSSELVATNFSSTAKTLRCSFVADGILNPNSTALFFLALQPGEQRIIPNLVQQLRDTGVTGLGAVGSLAGSLFVVAEAGDLSGIFVGARTSAAGGGGKYGLFYAAVPFGAASQANTWLFGLQQNLNNRTNLALVNTGETDSSSNNFTIELFDGETGERVATLTPSRTARKWDQIGSVLGFSSRPTNQGYAKVSRTSGTNPFVVYAVINDGGRPNERTGDGAYIASSP